HRTRRDRESRRVDGNAARAAGASTAAQRYFAALCFFLASARRSVFFRRLARFLTLSLPWLCPISSKTQPLAPSRHVVVFQRRPKVIASGHVGRNRGRRLRPPEADCVPCDIGAGAS